MNRRDPSLDTLLQPHNEHLVVIPVLVEQLSLRLFGMTSALPEYVLLTALLLGTAALLFVYVKRRVGPWPALFAAVLLLFLGPAWEVLLWPFEITFVGPVLFGLAMLLALEREDRRGDVAACSVSSSPWASPASPCRSSSPPRSPFCRERRGPGRGAPTSSPFPSCSSPLVPGLGSRRRLARPSTTSRLTPLRARLDRLVRWSAPVRPRHQPRRTASADPSGSGRSILVAVVVCSATAVRKRAASPPGLWPVVAAAAANWFLTAFNASPGREPGASRYQYVGGVFVLMILANLLRGRALQPARPLDRRRRDRRRGRGQPRRPQGRAVTISTAGDADPVRHGRDRDRPPQRRPRVPAQPRTGGHPVLINIFAGPYLEAVDEYGSPAYSPSELDPAPAQARRRRPTWSSPRPCRSRPSPASAPTTPVPPARTASRCRRRPSRPPRCRSPPGLTRIEVAPGPRAAFTLRRFADGEYPVATEGAPGDSVTLLRIPRDDPLPALVPAGRGHSRPGSAAEAG